MGRSQRIILETSLPAWRKSARRPGLADIPQCLEPIDEFAGVDSISSEAKNALPQPDRSQILAHLGIVAGLFDGLGISEVLERAIQQPPELRILTTADAIKAIVLNGLGYVHQPRSLGARFFQDNPPSRLRVPC